MGIIIKQSFLNTLASYIGVLLGAVNTLILFPKIFTADEFGLTRIIISASVIAANFFTFGIPNVTLKFFPHFNDKSKKHNGFLFFILAIPFVGYLLFVLFALLFKSNIIGFYADKTTLFGTYYYYVLAYSFYLIYFNVFDAYLRTLFKTTIISYLREVVLRFLWMILIIIYYYKYLTFSEFIFYFTNVYAILLLVEIIYVIYLKQLFLKPDFKLFTKKMIKKVAIYGGFIILGTNSGVIAATIDSLMIGALDKNGLSSVAYYAIAIYIGVMITIPYDGIIRIASSIISDAWSKKDILHIKTIYKQTSINLLIIGTLIFLGIWINVDAIFKLLPPAYINAKYALFFICLAKLYDVSTGVNATIIQFSSFYKLILYFNILFVFFVVLTNYLLIPIYSLTGAALATFISIFSVNTFRMFVIKYKMNVYPFTIKSLYVPVLAIIVYYLINLIPNTQFLIINILVRSIGVSIVFIPIIYFLKISEEFNTLIDKSLQFCKLKRD